MTPGAGPERPNPSAADAGRPPWLRTALLAGVLYAVVGVATAALAGAAASERLRFLWRLSAFGASAVVVAAHVAHDHFQLHSDTRSTAWHVSVGAALGGLGLALWANVHDLASATGYRPRMLVALVAWPLLTGVPAFLAALVLAAGLGAKRRS